MSLSLTITESIEEVIQTFIERVATKYNLNNTELKSLWQGDEVKTKKIETKTPAPPKDTKPASSAPTAVDPNALLKCNKAELIALCKTHGHKCSGTKSDLLNRLLGKDDAGSENGSDKESAKPKTESKSKAAQQAAVKATPVAQKLTANIPHIIIRRNKFNNYEHPETGLIFDNDSQIVIGKQKEDGTVEQLDEDAIDQCNAYKFKFKIPNNLDQKSSLLNVKVDELDDEEEEEEEEVEKEDELAEEDLLEDEEDLLGDEDDFEEYLSENE